MNRFVRALLVLAALCIAFSTPAWALKRTAVGEDGYEFTLETLEGDSVTLSENLGSKATLLIFWAAWSPRSHELLADYQTLHTDHAADGLRLIAINVEHPEWDPTEVAKIRAAGVDAGATYTLLLDKDYTVFNDYGVVAVPSVVMLDPTGTVTGILEGYASMTKATFRDDILRQLGVLKEPEIAEEKAPRYQPKGKSARYYMMGKRLADKKRFTRAVTQLERAVEMDPEYADAFRELARVYNKLNRPQKADTALARATELDAANPALAVTPDPSATPANEAATSTGGDGHEENATPKASPEKHPEGKADDNSAAPSTANDTTASLVQ